MRHIKAVKNLCQLEVSETAVSVNFLVKLKELKRLILVHNYEWGCQKIREVEDLKNTRNNRFLRLPKEKRRTEALRALKSLITSRQLKGERTHV